MFQLDEATALLRRAPAVFSALLADLPDAWLNANEGGDTWTARDVLAHVTELEQSDWPVRLRIIMREGTAGTFASVDRVKFRGVFANTSVPALLATFAAQRETNLAELASLKLSADDMRRGANHPSFGPVSLPQFLSAWTVHDLTHIGQIARVMAKRYDQDVGPWRQYLSILHDRT